ncbi:MAG: hypothetical protein IJD88_04585 [Clostridia bacterium]|nr:hypothetical protein [Clostridia bacterium]
MSNVNILESFITGKKANQKLNEDGLVITKDFIAVIDGASNTINFDGCSGGLIAKNILAEGISKLNSDITGFEAINFLNNLLNEAQKENPEAQKDPSKRLMASILIYSVYNKQIWSYGDCKYRINNKVYQFDKKIDELNAQVRCFVNQSEMQRGCTESQLIKNDIGANFIKPLLEYQHLFSNKNCEFGYPILDGFALNESFFVCEDVHDGDIIILATDGYPQLLLTLEDSERFLKDVLQQDPLFIKDNKMVKGFYEGYNSFDDRTFIKFVVN